MKKEQLDKKIKEIEDYIIKLNSLLESYKSIREHGVLEHHKKQLEKFENESKVESCIEVLEEVLNQACLQEDGTLDSLALSAYARGLRFLARRGRVKVISEHGRRVIAKFVERGD